MACGADRWLNSHPGSRSRVETVTRGDAPRPASHGHGHGHGHRHGSRASGPPRVGGRAACVSFFVFSQNASARVHVSEERQCQSRDCPTPAHSGTFWCEVCGRPLAFRFRTTTHPPSSLGSRTRSRRSRRSRRRPPPSCAPPPPSSASCGIFGPACAPIAHCV